MKNELVTPQELEAAKLMIKTKLLNSIETSDSQTAVLNSSKDSLNGIATVNDSLKLIDEVSAQDIQNAAKYIFSGNSITSILASRKTLDNMNLPETV